MEHHSPEEKQRQIGSLLSKYRELLNSEIAKIDPTIIVELAVGPHIGDEPQSGDDLGRFFSDWPDTWNDHGRWVKTWGKGGGEMELRPLEELRMRLQMARLRDLNKR